MSDVATPEPGRPDAPHRHTYRLLTGPDDAEFCARVSDAIAAGYRLYGSPSLTFNGTQVIAAQAVVLPQVALGGAPRGEVPQGEVRNA